MIKLDMVRCFILSPRPQRQNPEGAGKQVRYIPRDIFRLWKYIMTHVKGFQVTDEIRSFWVDNEMYTKESSAYGTH